MHKSGINLIYAVRAALFAAFIAVCSYIAIPTAPPITLQLFAITLATYAYGGVFACASVLIYLALGAVGLPVFSGFLGGIGHLLGASGGFLFGFIAYSLIYALLERLFGKQGKRRIVYTSVSLLVLYIIGSVWYTIVYLGGGFEAYISSLIVTVVPFILPDIIKIFLAYIIAERLKFKRR